MRFVCLSFCLIAAFPAWCQSDDPLHQTLEVLRSPGAREGALNADAKARQADDSVSKLVGSDPQSREAVYGISANVFEKIAASAGSDPAAVSAVVSDLQKNPEKLKSFLSPEDLKALQGVAQKIESGGLAQPLK